MRHEGLSSRQTAGAFSVTRIAAAAGGHWLPLFEGQLHPTRKDPPCKPRSDCPCWPSLGNRPGHAMPPAIIYDAGCAAIGVGTYSGAAYNRRQALERDQQSLPGFGSTRGAAQAAIRHGRRGRHPIIAMSFSQASAIREGGQGVSPKFAIIDDGQSRPTCSRSCSRARGQLLVGMMAAMASKTGKVGFVGGMDIPLIRKFQCGYEQGAKAGNLKAEVFANATGTTRGLGTTRPVAVSWPGPVRQGRGRGLRRGRRHRQSASTRRPRTAASWPSAWTATRTTCSPARC